MSIPLNKLPCSSVCGLVLGLYHTTLLKILQWEAYCQIIWFALLNPFKSYLTSKTIDASERKRDNSKCFKSELSSSNRDNSDSDTRTFFFQIGCEKDTNYGHFFSFVLFIFWFLYFFLYACIRLDNRATLRNLRKVIGCCRSNLYQLFLIPEGITVKVEII